MKRHFQQMAAYNRWANARLYAAAFALDDTDYRRDIGLFFGSLHGTLNHLLVADRIWFRRLTGEGEHPDRLDAIMFDRLPALALARAAEDERIIAVVDGYGRAAFEGEVDYATTSGQKQRQRLDDILTHVFNHQTHHRGQAHTALSILTGDAPPSLDLLAMQRGDPAPELARLAGDRLE